MNSSVWKAIHVTWMPFCFTVHNIFLFQFTNRLMVMIPGTNHQRVYQVFFFKFNFVFCSHTFIKHQDLSLIHVVNNYLNMAFCLNNLYNRSWWSLCHFVFPGVCNFKTFSKYLFSLPSLPGYYFWFVKNTILEKIYENFNLKWFYMFSFFFSDETGRYSDSRISALLITLRIDFFLIVYNFNCYDFHQNNGSHLNRNLFMWLSHKNAMALKGVLLLKFITKTVFVKNICSSSYCLSLNIKLVPEVFLDS